MCFIKVLITSFILQNFLENCKAFIGFLVKIKGQKNIKFYGSDTITIRSPYDLPEMQIIEEYFEPMAIATIICPMEYMKEIYKLCQVKSTN